VKFESSATAQQSLPLVLDDKSEQRHIKARVKGFGTTMLDGGKILNGTIDSTRRRLTSDLQAEQYA
jgi:hypothetical protein